MPSSSEKSSKFDPTDLISMSGERGGAAGAPSTNITENEQVKQRWNDIRKSPNDKRDYRGLILSNDMKILLISDPTTDKSAASMDVNVGHMSDPWDVPGLAHFCEHMLFLGTEKYPNKNEYSSFLSQNGGVYNAVTRSDSTNYYFDVIPEQLNGSLDRFAQFFLSPLFTESATELELQAVDSESAKNMANDTWRIDQIDKSTALKNHDYSKFGTGNAQTLSVEPKNKGINVRDELLKFHNHWYSSNIMALSVLGKESLDELEKLVVDLFVNVKNKNTEAAVWTDHPFNEQHYKKKLYIVPIKDVRNLKMIFPLPDLDKYYHSVPSQYISHLLGHEGNGSLLSAFKNFGWCNSLVAGPKNTARGNVNFFTVIVDLTEEGMKHIDDIIKLTFQYINMIKSSEPHEWIFNEYKEIAQMEYNFKEKKQPRDAVKITSRNLQKYPIDELLSVPYLPTEWRPDLIKSLYDYLLPKNIRVHIVAQAYDGIADKTEYWYGTKYSEESIPDCIIEKWSEPGWPDYLKLPTVNEFIPKNFDIKQVDDSSNKTNKYPVIIDDTSLMRVWFKQDDEFKVPKLNITIDFSSPLAYADPLSYNLTFMYIQLFKDSLNEYSYNAGLAGLSWELSSSKYGVVLYFGGYHDKHRILLDKILDKMVNFKIDKKRFDILKENYIRSLKNFDAEQPYQHAVYYLAVLLAEHVWTKSELLDYSDDITIENLELFVPQLLQKMFVECLLHGNITESDALDTTKIIRDKLMTNKRPIVPLLAKQLMLYREICLDNGCQFLYELDNIHHKSSCTEIYYQCGVQSTENNMNLELLVQLISEPCFNVLRTKEQLGYIVFSGVLRTNGAQGLRIIVQSDKHPNYVEKRIDEFVKSILDIIIEMSDDEFARHKSSLASKRLEKPKTLYNLSSIFWGEISTHQYNFDRANIEVSYLMTISKEQIIKYFKEMIDCESPCRRKLTVHVVSMANGGAGTMENNDETIEDTKVVKITDVNAFKASQSLYPLMKPFNDVPQKGQKSKL
ncbi:hypothetical protein HCN44_003576 [Aphidius gifuensis]|uniref:Insulin-degrading enzyme n=1 Tax=Aphidius gifuensis TaxID=684658 RepID=A0A834XK67_APHGI|nr:insulin-degrading enzyme isoform X2 [Aphidius gifuensis]KAF7987713.1 hypothetical protein HCN44_003576 [Aphidius gifuensis]